MSPRTVTIPISALRRAFSRRRIQSRKPFALLWLLCHGRLKDGVTIEQARAQLQSFWPDVLLATASTETPGPPPANISFDGPGCLISRKRIFQRLALPICSAALCSRRHRRIDFACSLRQPRQSHACPRRRPQPGNERARRHWREPLVPRPPGLTESSALSLTGALLGLVFAFWGSRLLVVLMTQGSIVPGHA